MASVSEALSRADISQPPRNQATGGAESERSERVFGGRRGRSPLGGAVWNTKARSASRWKAMQ
ncbi:hypothetical protein GCM10009733_110300 [Nonomuraea maheshkhaliensis]|uniref:Uncharacterized protein n=1 Tax=Nonomuraea maheshkhaliensis TaxID=419590 RepID=A0ABN2I1J3_9ACTN